MKRETRWWMRGLSVALGMVLLFGTQADAAEPPPPGDDATLAQRYAPVFYFHPAELFRPQPVEVIVEQARLRESRRLWFDINLLLSPQVRDLLTLPSDSNTFLDVWYGDEGSSASTNYSAHRAYYQALLSPAVGGPSPTVYAHVVRDEDPDHITIQYWASYFYNDWFNKHEGDWEMVEVVLSAAGEPEWVILSQHHGGTRRPWAAAPVEEETHPVAYVALGSHANYFVGNEVYPNGQQIGRARVEIMDRTGDFDRTVPDVVLLPEREELAVHPDAWPGVEWLPFQGRWGQGGLQGDFSGPYGPADKGVQWEQPYAWGMAQPLDINTWYEHRLRVEVVGAPPERCRVRLSDGEGRPLPAVEELGNLALWHSDPPTGTSVVASISVPPETRWDIVATWPDRAAGQVTRLRFNGVRFSESGQATLTLSPGGTAHLAVHDVKRGDRQVEPSAATVVSATWDAPDMVWVAGVLPAHLITTGLLIALLGAVVPTAIYVGLLYWADRYEKEPKRLLAAAFAWGALPALAVAGVAELFFRLPPNLVGPQALEAVRLGVFAPLAEETLKGAVVLFIAFRYRREFDDTLDGIIYGGMVGFGFAMTGNLLSYVSSFALWGFAGLDATTFIRGTIHALNHALYSGIFGAALGLARLARSPRQRWTLPLVGFLLAVAAHGLHGLLARSLLGLNVLTVLTTGIGLVLMGLVVGWALARQRRVLATELSGLLPDPLYRAMTAPGGRSRAQWQALRQGGVRAWRKARRLHQLCAEFAFKRMQARLRPDEPEMAREAEALWETIRQKM